MSRRHELTDAGWEFVRPLLPRSIRGRSRLDDRKILNGIVWKFRSGVAWRDVPERYGSWATLHTRFRRWAKNGTFTRMFQRFRRARSSDQDRRAAGRRPGFGVTACSEEARFSPW
ncbi:transposase [Streptomyces xiangluensis]|uniref:Transposase n=1 Tax=Streptomyces xiangluensis TaxID=2665720 RepID=A0ABV8YK04_9ACTN